MARGRKKRDEVENQEEVVEQPSEPVEQPAEPRSEEVVESVPEPVSSEETDLSKIPSKRHKFLKGDK